MNKLKPIVRCLTVAALASALLPVAQAENLFGEDSSTTNIDNLTLTNLSISCPAAADAFYVHQRVGCYATVTFAGKNAVALTPEKGAAAAALASGLVWSTDNTGVTLPGTCGTTGCISPLLGVDKSVTADGSVKVSATLTLGGVTKTASTSVKLFAPIALKVSCPASAVSGSKLPIQFQPLQDDKDCYGSTYFSDGVKGDVTPFLTWSTSNAALATATNPTGAVLLPPTAPSPLVASYQPGWLQVANVTSDGKVDVQAAGAGLTGSASLQITTKPTPPGPVSLLISCPQVLRAGNTDRCYAGIRVNDNIAKLVNVKWSSSDKNVVSIDDDGKVTGGAVTSSSKATITATYTGGDTPTLPPASVSVTTGTTGSTTSGAATGSTTTSTGDTPTTGGTPPVTATATITVIPAASVTLSSLAVNCTPTLTSGTTGNCRADAMYSDDSKKDVTAVWTSSNTSIATVDATGKVTALAVNSPATVTITGSYTEGGVTKTATGAITINPVGTPGGVPPLSKETMECFFAWAETQFPELFPTGGSQVPTAYFGPYVFRNYPIDTTFLGFDTTTNNVIYVGPFSGNALLRLGEFTAVWSKPSGCK